jgi:hypothetical protein
MPDQREQGEGGQEESKNPSEKDEGRNLFATKENIELQL